MVSPKSILSPRANQYETPVPKPVVNFETRLKAIGEILVLSGANPNERDEAHWAPVHLATKCSTTAVIKWLSSLNKVLESLKMNKFDFGLPGGTKNWTPLHVASY